MPLFRIKIPGPWKQIERRNWVLGHWGAAAGRNLARPAALLAGEVVGEDHKLAWCRFVARVGAARPSAMARGGARRWQHCGLGILARMRRAPGNVRRPELQGVLRETLGW
jgi:hypothetical protein